MPEVMEGYRLSPQQKRRWQLRQDGLSGRARADFLLEGSLDARALREAVGLTVERHEILRTNFHLPPGGETPIQTIAETGAVEWRALDWAARDPEEQAVSLAELRAEDERSTQDTESDSPVRAAFVTLGPDRHLLHLSLDALCADASTFANLAGELAAAYEACLDDGEPAGEVVQYLRFSEWQNELLDDENAALGFAYWRQQDVWAAPQPALPFERGARAEGAAAGRGSVEFVLDEDTTARLDELARRYESAPEALLLAGWQTLLSRVTGQADFTVGYVAAGRKFDELQEACGLFAKVVPVRARLAADAPFGEAVRRAGSAAGDAAEWQEWFAWPEGRRAGGDPPSSLRVGFELAPWPPPRTAGGVTLSLLGREVSVDRFGLKLELSRRGASTHARLDYDAGLFRADDIARLAEQFRTLLLSACERPEGAAEDLSLLSEAERRRLVVEFNETRVDYPRDETLSELFEAQAARTPDAAAVAFRDERLTYRELNERANRLARHLRGLGVGPESIVAVACERSPELAVALLGVLKAGGAYLPLDLTYPAERVAFMLQEAAVPVLLAQERLLPQLPVTGAALVCLDADWSRIADHGGNDLTPLAQPDNPAYVIFTSGSTGRPKGVVVPHRGLVNYLSWASEAYGVGARAASVVHSPVGFDLTVTTLFSPLLVGRCVVLVPEEEGVQGLSTAIQSGVDLSLVKLTPSHLEVLSQLLPPEAAGAAATVVIGGEALTGEHVAFWREHAPATRLINEYGPTETVVGCAVYELPADAPATGAVPIGRPIANARLYVLDSRLRPTATYVAGELYVGGDGVARGYHGRPDLTAERFVPDPFGTTPGGRLYKTGDLARHLPGGQLEFLGRLDHQVKIRGFRVEPGEIEFVLGQHEGVRDAFVVLREDVPGDARLVAYFTAAGGTAPSTEELRAHLHEQLPEHMIPAALVGLDALPLTPNGKIDRDALPAPEGMRPRLKADYVAPQTDTESVISAIWQEVLRIERVGVHDNFFDLGGHSLLLVRVNRKLQERFETKVSMIDLFRYPTISALAQFIGEGQGDGTPAARGEGRARERKESAAQQRELREKRRAAKGTPRG